MAPPDPRRPSMAKPTAAPPEPTHEFAIPSLHDSLPLACRIYSPSATVRDPEATGGLATGKDGLMRGAVVAHPYAPTGGSYDDRIVMGVVEMLLECGWTVGTFNFRGVKGSKGSTSWTARPEIADYKSMLGCMVTYLATVAGGRTPSHQPLDVEMVLAGYSYGSMIMSQVGDVSEALAAFTSPAPGSAAEGISRLAREAAQKTLAEEDIASVPAPLDKLPAVKPAYLLVSPLLPPISGMLGLSLPSVPKGIKNLFRSKEAAEVDDAHSMDSPLFLRHPTFAIFGSDESFTSPKKLSSWGERMSAASPVRTGAQPPRRGSAPLLVRQGSISGSRSGSVVQRLFEWEMVEDAGHFWRESSVEGIMKSKVRAWASTL